MGFSGSGIDPTRVRCDRCEVEGVNAKGDEEEVGLKLGVVGGEGRIQGRGRCFVGLVAPAGHHLSAHIARYSKAQQQRIRPSCVEGL